jgi:1,5-anhydro-D-fructose reductase (1,5-anhydro-D-mannitol-forming)
VTALDDADGVERRVDFLLGCVARAGDALVSITSSRRLPNAANSLVVYGSTCRLDALGTIGVVPAGTLQRTANGESEAIELDLCDHYQAQIEAFARAAAGGDGGALATAADGVASVRAAAAVAEAARTGRRVPMRLAAAKG